MARALLIEPGAREVLSREPGAARIRAFTSSVMPGLMQTEDYAHALTRVTRPTDSAAEVRELVAARMQRQRHTVERERPPLYRAVIDEAALARPVGTNSVMADQMRRLLAYAENSRVRVQVIPYTAREHGMMGGNLTLLNVKGGSLALVENFRIAQAVELPADVVEYEELYESVQYLALSVSESAEVIADYLKGYENE